MIYKSNDNFYSCYSPKLNEFLEALGEKPIDEFINLKTGKKCWVYNKTTQLSAYLKQWSKNKEQTKE